MPPAIILYYTLSIRHLFVQIKAAVWTERSNRWPACAKSCNLFCLPYNALAAFLFLRRSAQVNFFGFTQMLYFLAE